MEILAELSETKNVVLVRLGSAGLHVLLCHVFAEPLVTFFVDDVPNDKEAIKAGNECLGEVNVLL